MSVVVVVITDFKKWITFLCFDQFGSFQDSSLDLSVPRSVSSSRSSGRDKSDAKLSAAAAAAAGRFRRNVPARMYESWTTLLLHTIHIHYTLLLHTICDIVVFEVMLVFM